MLMHLLIVCGASWGFLDELFNAKTVVLRRWQIMRMLLSCVKLYIYGNNRRVCLCAQLVVIVLGFFSNRMLLPGVEPSFLFVVQLCHLLRMYNTSMPFLSNSVIYDDYFEVVVVQCGVVR